jgi:hypothetical protein
VPLIAPDEAAVILAEFHRLRGESGAGFDADLNRSDPEYRRTVTEFADARLGHVMRALFVDYEPFLWTYLCKWPGELEDLDLHRDWWFVDERAGLRSFSVWLALQDVGPDNGPLKILPYTHLLATEPTGTHLAPAWLGRAKTFEDRMVTVPVAAGHAIVMDHALAHGSHRNTSGRPRVALGCALRPAGAGLVHMRRRDQSTAVRYDVDPDFFLTHTPQELMDRPPALHPSEALVDISGRADDGALAERLDRLAHNRPR